MSAFLGLELPDLLDGNTCRKMMTIQGEQYQVTEEIVVILLNA
jgi:hypothetical protein